MILEIADFTVRPEAQDAFGAAMERGVQTIISKAAGYLRHEIQHCIETPGRFVLLIEWATLKTIPSISAARRRSPSGAKLSDRILPNPRTWSISGG